MEKDGEKLGTGKRIRKALAGFTDNFGKVSADVASKAKDAFEKTQQSVINVIDGNGMVK